MTQDPVSVQWLHLVVLCLQILVMWNITTLFLDSSIPRPLYFHKLEVESKILIRFRVYTFERMLHGDADQIRSVTQSCPTLCNPMNRSMPGLSVHHQLPEFTETHIHRVSDAIQPSHPLSSPSPPALNPSQHQSLFQWVNSSHEVAKVLEFQL